MDAKPIAEGFAVCGQVQQGDIADIAAAGFRTLICHRPDGEEVAQPSATEVANWADAAGLKFILLPFSAGELSAEVVEQYRELYRHAERPVLGYCRSGQRAETIWNEAACAAGD